MSEVFIKAFALGCVFMLTCGACFMCVAGALSILKDAGLIKDKEEAGDDKTN